MILQDEFVPTNLEGWSRVVAQTLTIGAIVFGALKWVLMQPINGLGRRVNDLEKQTAKGDESRFQLRDDVRDLLNASKQRDKDLGRLQTGIDGLQTAVEYNRNQRLEEDQEVRERLARIEESLDGDRELKLRLLDLLQKERQEN